MCTESCREKKREVKRKETKRAQTHASMQSQSEKDKTNTFTSVLMDDNGNIERGP